VVSDVFIGGAVVFGILLTGSEDGWFCTIAECMVLQFAFIGSSAIVLRSVEMLWA
jgi:hypothetical protein